MPRELLLRWLCSENGKDRATNAGYAVYSLPPPHERPADRLVDFDERIGDGHGAFRLVNYK